MVVPWLARLISLREQHSQLCKNIQYAQVGLTGRHQIQSGRYMEDNWTVQLGLVTTPNRTTPDQIKNFQNSMTMRHLNVGLKR